LFDSINTREMVVQQLWDQVLNAWPYDEHMFFVFASWLVPTLTFWMVNGLLYIIYHFQLFEEHKIQKAKWPDRALVKACLRDLVVNHFIIRPFASYYLYYVNKYFGMQVNGPIPSWQTICVQIFASIMIMDFLFYWSHRFLHHRLIYKYIHKQHHEFKTTIGIASEYAHPIEGVISNIIPTIIGPILQGAHLYVFLLWLFIRELETLDAHSGFKFPFSPFNFIPFQGGADRHDFHHSHNVGNFGAFFIFWDWLCGTDVSYTNWKQKEKKIK